jgi:hypothetical protein
MENVRLKKDYPEATNYTFLDFLLNNNHYRLFNKLYQTIITNIALNKENSRQFQHTPSGIENMEVDETSMG